MWKHCVYLMTNGILLHVSRVFVRVRVYASTSFTAINIFKYILEMANPMQLARVLRGLASSRMSHSSFSSDRGRNA